MDLFRSEAMRAHLDQGVRGPGYWHGIYWQLKVPPIILIRNREESTPDGWHVIYRQTKVRAITTGMITARLVRLCCRLCIPMGFSEGNGSYAR